ncbi:hypothetical protein B0H14DRAFT_3003593, partial [Mycena olivaceomarginata]
MCTFAILILLLWWPGLSSVKCGEHKFFWHSNSDIHHSVICTEPGTLITCSGVDFDGFYSSAIPELFLFSFSFSFPFPALIYCHVLLHM